MGPNDNVEYVLGEFVVPRTMSSDKCLLRINDQDKPETKTCLVIRYR